MPDGMHTGSSGAQLTSPGFDDKVAEEAARTGYPGGGESQVSCSLPISFA